MKPVSLILDPPVPYEADESRLGSLSRMDQADRRSSKSPESRLHLRFQLASMQVIASQTVHMPEHADFGRLLKAARLRSKQRQDRVAHKVGVSASFLRRVERGAAMPSLLVFASLRQLLALDANEFLDTLGIASRPIPARLHKHRPVARVRTGGGRFVAFGMALARSRLEAGQTQEAVAYAVNCSVRFLARIEAGGQLPAVVLFAKMRRVLGFDANALLEALNDGSPMEPFHSLGHLLASARDRAGIDAVDVARAVGCGVEAYKRVERGYLLPSVLELARLHQVLRFNGNSALRAIWKADSLGKNGA